MKRAGIGGVELSFLGQNGEGWGSEQWFTNLSKILYHANRLGIEADIMPGVHWVTSAKDVSFTGDASEKELQIISRQMRLAGNTAIEIPVPNCQDAGPGNHDFDSRGSIHDAQLVGVTAWSAENGPRAEILSGPKSEWIDLRDETRRSSVIPWTPPHPGLWTITSFWNMPTGILIRGVPAIDHFSPCGSRAVTDYWDTQMACRTELCELLRNTGRYLFLDSLELGTSFYWTNQMAEEFEKRRGYALLPWLHCIYNSNIQKGVCQKVRRDFSQTLTELLGENYFAAFDRWCRTYGLELRAQSCYGIWAEMAQVSMYISCPETERLGFTDSIDGYRGQAGTVHIQKKAIYSAEVAPVLGAAWRQTWAQMLFHIYRCFAAGVNQVVLHGYAYQTDSEDIEEQWPGYSPMAPLFSEELGARIPSWRFVSPVLTSIARQQWFLQQGSPVVDLAVYRHSDREECMCPDYLTDDTLDRCGYAYDFISPSQLKPDKVAVMNGRLFPQGPSYKALLLVEQKHLPVDVSQTFLSCAAAGLPVIFIGGIPEESSYLLPEDGDATVCRNIDSMFAYENVTRVKDLPQVAVWLRAHGLVPAQGVHSLPLECWDITLSIWQPTEEYHLQTKTTTLKLPQHELMPWERLAGKPVSGIGYYYTEFTLPNCWNCVLELGQVLDLCTVHVNGREAPAVNPITGRTDISKLVQSGVNSLDIQVGSNLYGAMCTLHRTFEDIVGQNAPHMAGIRAEELPKAAGLLGPVLLRYSEKNERSS